MSKRVRIGVDVGGKLTYIRSMFQQPANKHPPGTNTDAVAIDPTLQHSPSRGVLAHHKAPTTPDVTSGIEEAVRKVLEQSAIPSEQIASVTVGTTAFLNSVVEQDARRLSRVAIIRLSKSFLREVKPFSDWPPGLTNLIKGYVGYVDGGLHIDGSEEAPVVEEQVVRECQEIKKLGLTAIVIAGVYSPIDETHKQEDTVKQIVLREIPGADVVCSHEVANIGFLERENASILNASILKYARKTVKRFRSAMKSLRLTCPLFLTQNDGTLLDSYSAARVPIRTFSSGATNSMRGAAYLAGHDIGTSSAIVVDVGGTTSDVGVLLPSGLPRQASAYVTVAGVRVNYSMPHLHSIGLGGGSLVRQTDGKVTVGPDSVGHYLTSEALVFGGKTTTATDIAVAAGKASIGASGAVEHLTKDFIKEAEDRIKALLEGAIDLIKTSPEPLPVLLVGGGSMLAPESLAGSSKLIRPPFHDVANAVGAACSKAGGSVDIVQGVSSQTEAQATEYAKNLAIKRAIAAGAVENSVFIAEIETMPLQYVANQLRTIVKAVGELDIDMQTSLQEDETEEEEEVFEEEVAKSHTQKVMDVTPVDPRTYRPTIVVDEATGISEWYLTETDLGFLADGCYVLGCAGGGSPAASKIQLRDMLRSGHRIRVIDSSDLEEKANIYWGGHMGSPATSVERLQSLETVEAFKVLMEYLREDSFDAVMGLEIGGANGMEPFLVGSSRFFDRPIIDADWMGRAYPTYHQTVLAVHAPGQLVPCAIDSGDGISIIMTRASNDEIVDRALRASCSEMGSRVGMAAKPTTKALVTQHGVQNTISLAWRIGRCIAKAEASNSMSTIAEAIVEEAGGSKSAKVLFRGKIVAVERRLFKGHSYGEVHIASVSTEEDDGAGIVGRVPAIATGGLMKIPFKNENIYAEHVAEDGTSRIIAAVPDLVCVLDKESGKALGVPEFKYGYQVIVLGITCSPRWTETPRGLAIGGPKAFGYDIEYKPLGEYVEPRSVVKEYGPR